MPAHHLQSYSRTAIILHWVMAPPIILLLLFGEHTMGNHNGRFLPTLHASAGFLLLAMAACRLVWRHRHKPPALPETMTPFHKLLASLSHLGLYAAMVLLPLTGWFAYTEHVRRSMGVAPASFFWFAKIPLLPDYGINFHFMHKWGGKAVIALVVLHILAALKHHFYDRDDVLKRMLR